MSETDGKSWARQIVALYEQGYSDAEVAAEMRITIKEYYKRIGDDKTFAKLIEFGRTLSQAFWEGQARKNLSNKQFNTPLWAFYMKNKYAWADKTEAVTMNENVNTDLDSLRTKVNAALVKFVEASTPELTDAKRMLQDQSKVINEQ